MLNTEDATGVLHGLAGAVLLAAAGGQRFMGAYGLNNRTHVYQGSLRRLHADDAELEFLPVGCIVQSLTVGAIVEQLQTDPHRMQWPGSRCPFCAKEEDQEIPEQGTMGER